MTLNDLMSNISKGQAAIAVKHVLAALNQHYQSLKSNIKLNGIKKDDNSTTLFFLIPSTTKKIYYDVVVEVAATDKLHGTTEIKLYSNSPSFAFNFAYLFYQASSLLYPEKYSKEFKLMPPKTRNPFGLYGFDKTTYCGIQYIVDYGLKNIRDNYNDKIPQVKTFDQKQQEVNEYTTRNQE